MASILSFKSASFSLRHSEAVLQSLFKASFSRVSWQRKQKLKSLEEAIMSKTKKILGIIAVIPLLCLALTGCVSEALSIDISSPEDGAELTESPVTVTGIVSGYPRGEAAIGEQTARLVPEVTVNGIKAEVAADGSFSAQVELTEGENAIEAVALLGNQQAKDTITVTYAPPVPVLSVEITSPEDGAELTESLVTVSGTVSEPEATVTVNGIEAEVAEDGSFSAQVELTEGENVITAVAVVGELEAEDSVTVTYTPGVKHRHQLLGSAL
jgi:nitrogen fixation protein FixH